MFIHALKVLALAYVGGDYFEVNHEREMKFWGYFERVDSFFHCQNTFYAVMDAGSITVKRQSILVFNESGELIKEFDKRGYGPGEIRRVSSISVLDDRLYLMEAFSGLIHVKDLSLSHIEDLRIEIGGFLAINTKDDLGVWRPRVGNTTTHMLTLYDRHTRKARLKAMAMKSADVPPFVSHYGGIASMGDGYIGVFANDYRPVVLDHEFRFKKRLFNLVPAHVVSYYPWKKDRQKVKYHEMKAWIESWFLMENIFVHDDMILICYSYSGEHYMDIYDKNANLLAAKINIGGRLYGDNQGQIWRVRKEERVDNHFYFGKVVFPKAKPYKGE